MRYAIRTLIAAAGLAAVTVPVPAVEPTASDDSSFASQSVPSSLDTGASLSVSVTFVNTGTTSWSPHGGYVLGSPDPSVAANWEVSDIGLPSEVTPGSRVTFTFRVTAPDAPGTYNFQWQMERGTTFFGAKSANLPIRVVARPGV